MSRGMRVCKQCAVSSSMKQAKRSTMVVTNSDTGYPEMEGSSTLMLAPSSEYFVPGNIQPSCSCFAATVQTKMSESVADTLREQGH
jgi:hypothetical protein